MCLKPNGVFEIGHSLRIEHRWESMAYQSGMDVVLENA